MKTKNLGLLLMGSVLLIVLVFILIASFNSDNSFIYMGGTNSQNPLSILKPALADYLTNGSMAIYLSLNQSTSVMTDSSDYGLDGTVTGGSRGITGATSYTDNAFNCTGTGKVEATAPTGSNQFTVCQWVNPYSTTSPNNLPFISAINVNNYPKPFTFFMFGPGNSTVRFNVGNGASESSVNLQGALPLNTWSHLCGSYDGSDIKLYYNGVLNKSKSVSQSISWASSTVTLCNRGDDYDYFPGSIDEFVVYNRSLNSSEIQAVYNNTPWLPEGPLTLSITINNPSNLTTNLEEITNITINTDLGAVCQYAYNQTFIWGQGVNMSTNGTLHWLEVANNNNPQNLSYSYICQNSTIVNNTLLNHVFATQNITANNTFGFYGDSTVTGSTGPVVPASTYVNTNLSNYVYYSITSDNDGVDGSCLTQSCNGKEAFIDTYPDNLTSQNEVIFYLSPHVNDFNANVSPNTYITDFEKIITDSIGNNSKATILTGSSQPITDIRFTTYNSTQINAGLREIAVIYELPFLEWKYKHNWNSSYQTDGAHMNQLGHTYWGSLIWELYTSRNTGTYNINNWSIYIYGSDTRTYPRLNATIKMPTAVSYLNTSSDWAVIKNITSNSFYVERLDKDVQFNLTNRTIGQTYSIEFSNGSTQSKTVDSNGNLEINILADTDLSVIYSIDSGLNIISPTNTLYNTSSIALNVTNKSLINVWYYNLNGAGNISFTPNTTITATEGANSLIVYGNDSLLNAFVNDTVSFNVDSTAPISNTSTNRTYIYKAPDTVFINFSFNEDNPAYCYITNVTLGTGIIPPTTPTKYYFSCANTTLEIPVSMSRTNSGDYQNIVVYINDTANLMNYTAQQFYVSPIDPSVNITYPTGTFNYILEGSDTTDYLNWSILTNGTLDTCYYEYNNTNTSVTCGNNQTLFNITGLDSNLTLWANDTLGNLGNGFTSWIFKLTEVNQSYVSPSATGSLDDFTAWVKLGNGYSISSATFTYNNTDYTSQVTNYGTYSRLLYEDFPAPSVGTVTNFTFYFTVTLNDSTAINLTAHNQTISPLLIDNCSTYTNTLYNFTLVDEEEQTPLTGDIESVFTLYTEDRGTGLLNGSLSSNSTNNFGICTNDTIASGVSYSMDIIVKYTATGYAIEYYNIINDIVNNETNENITLYDLNENDTTEFRVTFKDSNYIVSPDTLIYVNRQYIAENNTFKTVELPKTDSNGQTILHLVRNDVVYNLIAVKDGAVLGQLTNIVAFCEDIVTGNCNIEFDGVSENVDGYNYYEDIGIISDGISYDSSSQIFSFDYSSYDGTSQEVNLTVYRLNSFGNRTLCTSSVNSSSSTLFCNVGSLNTDNSTLIARIFVNGVESMNTYTSQRGNGFGGIGYFASFIMVLSFVLMFGASNMEGQILGLLAGLVASFMLGLLQGGIIGFGAVGIYIIIAGVIMLYKLNKGKGPNG